MKNWKEKQYPYVGRAHQKKLFSLIMVQSLYVFGMPIGRSHKKFQLPKTKIDPPSSSKGLCSKNSTSDLSDCFIFYIIGSHAHIFKAFYLKMRHAVLAQLHEKLGGTIDFDNKKCKTFFRDFLM